MLVGTGLESTRETIRFTNEAARIGADYALVVTPCYYKGSMKPQILHDHFVAVAEASRIGILLYNVPQYTGVNMEPELVAKLSRHPNIVGIKDSSGNISQLSQIIHTSEEFFCLHGLGTCAFPRPLRRGGGRGSGGGQCGPPGMCQDLHSFHEGKLDQAQGIAEPTGPACKCSHHKARHRRFEDGDGSGRLFRRSPAASR